MPLREDLLVPIAGENPSGEDLHYDKVFDQIKEARREDEDNLPEGDWGRAQKKKADHRTVIKLAGEALAKRSKDLRLAAWLVESHLKVDGFQTLAPGIELLRSIQESFWPTLYPPIEDGGDLELRMLSVETAAKLIAGAVRKLPLTRSGLNLEDCLESRAVGYERDATTSAKEQARKDAIDRGKRSAEDFDKAFAASPKSLYTEANAALAEAIVVTGRLDQFQREIYKDNAPNLLKLTAALEEVHQLAGSLLNERRKTEPDPVQAMNERTTKEDDAGPMGDESELVSEVEPKGRTAQPRPAIAGQLSRIADAYALIVESALFLSEKDFKSPVPYLVCASLRLGETRMQGSLPAPGFACGPTPEIRQSLRAMAARSAWNELLRASLPILASECARAWLDLHRYIWQAGQETGADAISVAVVGTVKSLLVVRPELRHWTLEDDTGAANPETQQWLDAIVLQ